MDYCEILKISKNIAVVGISHNPNRPSRDIASYLKNQGYNVVGVNPAISQAGDIEVFPSLSAIPFEIDIVDVFRRGEFIPELIPEVIKVKPKVLWLQLGIVNDPACKLAEEHGIITIQNKCILIEHRNCSKH